VSALAGLRVLELTQVMAGPFCGQVLADMGADVLKIEPLSGDSTRESLGAAAFLAVNRNKRSVALDLKAPEHVAVLHRLVRDADVVLENYRPGVAARLGAGWETLSELNPRLIYASVSGFGQTGPYAQRPGYDLIAQGLAGLMSVTGEPGGDRRETLEVLLLAHVAGVQHDQLRLAEAQRPPQGAAAGERPDRVGVDPVGKQAEALGRDPVHAQLAAHRLCDRRDQIEAP